MATEQQPTTLAEGKVNLRAASWSSGPNRIETKRRAVYPRGVCL